MIIPSINCQKGATGCVYDKIAVARKIFKDVDHDGWVHLDIADGAFTFHKSWNDPDRWPHEHSPNTEVHLMVEDPAGAVDAWKDVPGVKRFIVHAEALSPKAFHDLKEKVRKAGKSIMLATNPETPVKNLEPYLKDVLQFQVLAVTPGASGQKFLPLTLRKIAWIRERAPNAIIEVDGGINLHTAHAARAAGADILVSDSYIFMNRNPVLAYKELAEI